MDEDILFDNIYLSNDPEEARAFAKETFHVKLPLEQNRETEDQRNDPEFETGHRALPSLPERTLFQIRRKTEVMITRLRYEPDKLRVLQQSYPIVGFWAAVVAVVLGLIGTLTSLVGGRAAPAPAPTKKVDAPAAAPATDGPAKSTAVGSTTKVTKRSAAE